MNLKCHYHTPNASFQKDANSFSLINNLIHKLPLNKQVPSDEYICLSSDDETTLNDKEVIALDEDNKLLYAAKKRKADDASNDGDCLQLPVLKKAKPSTSGTSTKLVEADTNDCILIDGDTIEIPINTVSEAPCSSTTEVSGDSSF